MKFLQSRKTAVVVFIAVVLVFSVIGGRRSLSRACRGVEDAFFDKTALTAYDYNTAPGDHLSECVKYANRLLSVINGSDVLTEGYAAVRDARQALSDALGARDISNIHAANEALVSAVSSVDAQVKAGAALPPSNDDYDTIVNDFFSAQRAAAQSPYNEYVDDFIQNTVRPFPTDLLRAVCSVSLPEKFA